MAKGKKNIASTVEELIAPVVVDEMGYVELLSNNETPVTITVKLNYLGEAFTDTCLVNVSEE